MVEGRPWSPPAASSAPAASAAASKSNGSRPSSRQSGSSGKPKGTASLLSLSSVLLMSITVAGDDWGDDWGSNDNSLSNQGNRDDDFFDDDMSAGNRSSSKKTSANRSSSSVASKQQQQQQQQQVSSPSPQYTTPKGGHVDYFAAKGRENENRSAYVFFFPPFPCLKLSCETHSELPPNQGGKFGGFGNPSCTFIF